MANEQKRRVEFPGHIDLDGRLTEIKVDYDNGQDPVTRKSVTSVAAVHVVAEAWLPTELLERVDRARGSDGNRRVPVRLIIELPEGE